MGAMWQALITLCTLAILLSLHVIMRQRQSALEETDGVEIYRGPPAEAAVAIERLADAGVVAWIEHSDRRMAVVHADATYASQIPQLLAHLREGSP